MTPPASPKAMPSDPAPFDVEATHRVLIVDDDGIVRGLLCAVLGTRNWRIFEAGSVKEALSVVAEHSIDLAIVDGLLPDGEGVDLIGELRRKHPRIKLVFHSAFWPHADELKRLSEEVGVDRVLSKPVAPGELLLHVEALLGVELEPPPVPGRRRQYATPSDMSVEDLLCALRRVEVSAMQATTTRLRKALMVLDQEEGSPEALEEPLRLARELRVTSGTYSMDEIAASASEMEAILQRSRARRCLPDTEQWFAAFEALARAERALSNLPEGPLVEEPGEPASFGSADAAAVLVVDEDAQELAEMATRALSERVRVVPARSTDEALARISEQHVDCALVDTMTGGSDAAYRLVRRLHGRRGAGTNLPVGVIGVDDSLNHRVAAARAGATLFLKKPVAKADLLRAVHRLNDQSSAGACRVLLISDDESTASDVSKALTRGRFEAVKLDDPREIFDKLERVRPAALLVDAVLPHLSGFDVCRMVRGSMEWGELPVILLTERSGADVRIAAFEAGADDQVSQPYVPRELLASLRVRLGRLQKKGRSCTFRG